MRHPADLSPDELATLLELWHVYPDGVLSRHDRDHTKHDALVADGYIERAESEDVGIAYRLAPVHAAGLAKITKRIAEDAARN
jgi:hypothetical protein